MEYLPGKTIRTFGNVSTYTKCRADRAIRFMLAILPSAISDMGALLRPSG
jgi:hypothetical protein